MINPETDFFQNVKTQLKERETTLLEAFKQGSFSTIEEYERHTGRLIQLQEVNEILQQTYNKYFISGR